MRAGKKNLSLVLKEELDELFEEENEIKATSEVLKADGKGKGEVKLKAKSDDKKYVRFTIVISDIGLKDNYAKTFFLYVRGKFKKWEYQDTLLNWQPDVVNKALKDYKKFMLDIVLGMTHGNVEPRGLLKEVDFLKLRDIYDLLKSQKNPDLMRVPETHKHAIETYMKMVFPFEKRIIFDLFQRGYVSTKGEFQNLSDAIKFLKLREAYQYKSEQEKELDQDVGEKALDHKYGEEDDEVVE